MLFCFGLCNKTFWNKWQKIHYDNTNYCRNVIINGIPHTNAKENVIAKRRKSDCTMRRWGLDQGYMTLILIQYISHITLYCSKLIYIYILCAQLGFFQLIYTSFHEWRPKMCWYVAMTFSWEIRTVCHLKVFCNQPASQQHYISSAILDFMSFFFLEKLRCKWAMSMY